MVRYVVTNLGPQTSVADQEKLVKALEKVKGIRDIALTLPAHEITFGIAGPEPKQRLLAEACASVGFTLGARM